MAKKKRGRRARSPRHSASDGMPFGTTEEAQAACLVVYRWLPEFVQRFEDAVRESGFSVKEYVISRDPDGAVDPILVLSGPGNWELELHLRNSLEGFLMIDRDERPAQFDARLLDDESAEEKLGDVVDGRIAMLRAIRDGRTPEKIKENIQKLAGGFERIRMTEYEK